MAAETMFIRPHRCACTSYVDMGIDLAAVRRMVSYADWRDAVAAELRSVYEVSPERIRSIAYSTKTEPTHFASNFDEKLFELLRRYDETTRQCATARQSYETAQQALHVEQTGRDPDKPLTRKERRLEKEQIEQIARLRRQTTEVEYELECLSRKLSNVFSIDAVRIYTNI